MIDWNMVSSIATAFGSLLTAVGVTFGSVQVRVTKKQAIAQFEDNIDKQYREISMALPVDVLIGGSPTEEQISNVRELIFNYLDLSNEQVYLRAKGRISKDTWSSWSSGIKDHLNRPAFVKVYEEVKERSGFTYLDKLVEEQFAMDPKQWN